MYYTKDNPSNKQSYRALIKLKSEDDLRIILEKMKSIKVKIKPGTKEARVVEKEDMYGNQTLEISVKSLPKKGRANEEMLELLGNYFNIPKTYVKIKSGFKSRNKTILISKGDA